MDTLVRIVRGVVLFPFRVIGVFTRAGAPPHRRPPKRDIAEKIAAERQRQSREMRARGEEVRQPPTGGGGMAGG